MRRVRWASALVAVLLGGISVASAQVVERNLPPAPQNRPGLRLDPTLLRSDDATPLGADLRAIILLGGKAKLPTAAASGVDIRTDVIDSEAIRSGLQPYLGQPLSRKLVTDIQATIAAVYRNRGRPFVSVTLPPQEITKGILRVRVVEGLVSGITLRGGSSPELAQTIRNGVRIAPGDRIQARRLDDDLDWLNRNPFRKVEAIFGPGKDLGQSELTLQSTETKPWQAYTGWSNTGTVLTGRDRYFFGGMAAWPGDIITSGQLTGSRDYWVNDGRALSDPTTAGYFSPSARILIPLWTRSSFEIVGDYVQTNERPVDPFRIRTRTSEVLGTYRTAVSNFIADGFGDFLLGAEAKRQDRRTFFSEVDVAAGRGDVAQFYAGWAGHWNDPWGINSLDVRVKQNPGGILPGNSNAAWSAYTNGRVTNIHIAFATLQYERRTPLPFGTSLLTEVTALISGQPLPDTERLGPGGMQLVRGYVTEDGVADRAFIMRNSLYLPAFSVAGIDNISPFLLADLGWGRDIANNVNTSLAAIGGGVDHMIATNLKTTFSAAYALRDSAYTKAGFLRLFARVTASY